MKRKLLISLAVVLAAALFTIAMVSADDTADVYVGHGIPGDALSTTLELSPTLPVDVALNGGCVPELQGLEFGEIRGPLAVPSGTYTVTISLADVVTPCAGPAVFEAQVPFEAGENATVIAHLTVDGVTGAGDLLDLGLTASKFVNDLSPIVPGKARLTVRHVANAPAVDIELTRGFERGRLVGVIEGLENPDETDPLLDIRPGAYQATIFAAGDEDMEVLSESEPELVAPPFDFELEPFKSYIVYAVGAVDPEDLEDDTFTVITQVLDGLEKDLPPRPEPPVPPGPPVMPPLPPFKP